ncbi:MAG TPA: plasmid stabilization protein [Burkholderiaceae bacterium]|jgi:plasmid stability protein
MATLTIRNLDDPLKIRLRLRAAARNRSMEEEARQILRAALQEPLAPTRDDLGARIHARFAALGDVQLPVEAREPVRTPSVPGGQARTRANAKRKTP